ncbi:J domain-containing protein [Candidatus Uhrbacteria bacterium]|nr:J domain-containing protein [Candidatus Uhrbacteria bacterium]
MNPYEILDVPRDADQETIKRVYHRLARETHPDYHGEMFLSRYKEIVEAYKILGDQERRAVYDFQSRPPASVQDLFNTDAGRRLLSTLFPQAPAARRDGEDLIVCLDEEDGYVSFPDFQHPGETLKVPIGFSHQFCRISDRGASGHGGGAAGRLFILPTTNKEGE